MQVPQASLSGETLVKEFGLCHQTRLNAAVDAHKAALDAELQAYGLVQQEKVNWFDSYKLNHRTLAQINYKEPKKADTYFKGRDQGEGQEADAWRIGRWRG